MRLAKKKTKNPKPNTQHRDPNTIQYEIIKFHSLIFFPSFAFANEQKTHSQTTTSQDDGRKKHANKRIADT
jgi:hypothetical protein